MTEILPSAAIIQPTVSTDADVQRSLNTILADPNLTVSERVAAANLLAGRTNRTFDQENLRTAAEAGAADLKTVNIPAPGEVTDEGNVTVTATKRFTEFTAADHRIRISAFPGQETDVYGPDDRTANILAPLHKTAGLLFPYTPTITVSQDTSWQSSDIEQTNYDILSFQKSSSASISLSAKFTAQNQREGEYMLSAIHFLRTVSKTYFGEADADSFADTNDSTATGVSKTRKAGRAGLPPPVLIFSGYGDLMFNNVRCVIKSHGWSFDENVDMVRFLLPTGSTVWLPPVLSISIGLGIQMNTDDVRKLFSLDEFRTGALLSGPNKGWF